MTRNQQEHSSKPTCLFSFLLWLAMGRRSTRRNDLLSNAIGVRLRRTESSISPCSRNNLRSNNSCIYLGNVVGDESLKRAFCDTNVWNSSLIPNMCGLAAAPIVVSSEAFGSYIVNPLDRFPILPLGEWEL